ncbi:MAG TPA: winged helix-turn-helix domain-containing protein [Bryobacteraceae bacterium]|nr:winged helix-turn-helix domain-containing protein [Bryobacteraceae bacterium]
MFEDARRRLFSFGVFEADEARGELRKRGIRIKLHAQPFRVLTLLLERPSEIVTREEMRQRLWGQDTFVDFDHGLNSAINKIRDALDDSASQPRFIETVSGKGYRFIAPVTLRPGAEMPAPRAGGDPSPPAPPPLADTVAAPLASILTTPDELPTPRRNLVRILLLLIQVMYLAFYLLALANLHEIDDLFLEARLLPPAAMMAILITTAAALIPVRLYLLAAIAFDLRQLPAKFARIFPVLALLDLLWALSPFLLTHYIATGLALGMSAALVYLPFAQRSLVLMYARGR